MKKGQVYYIRKSLSARRAWIEILLCGLLSMLISVALRKESVDRNTNPGSTTLTFPVALRKESVDRNIDGQSAVVNDDGSLSARRAWIEIVSALIIQSRLRCRSPQGERG